MTCSTESRPLASYKWTLNETELGNSSAFFIVVQQSSDGGNYSCHAVNSVTGRRLSAVHAVSVTQNSTLVLLFHRIFPSDFTPAEVIVGCRTSHTFLPFHLSGFRSCLFWRLHRSNKCELCGPGGSSHRRERLLQKVSVKLISSFRKSYKCLEKQQIQYFHIKGLGDWKLEDVQFKSGHCWSKSVHV